MAVGAGGADAASWQVSRSGLHALVCASEQRKVCMPRIVSRGENTWFADGHQRRRLHVFFMLHSHDPPPQHAVGQRCSLMDDAGEDYSLCDSYALD